jgi:hypothetical protein
MANFEITTNAANVADFFRKLQEQVDETRGVLLTALGRDLMENTQRRIKTANDGTWAPPSKWVQAKKGVNQALVGTEKYVKFRVLRDNLELYADIPGNWTFEQHEKGFKNVPFDKTEERDEHGRVHLELANPSALNYRFKVFAFVPRRAGTVPPRQVWPNNKQTSDVVIPIASRWLKIAVEKAGGSVL